MPTVLILDGYRFFFFSNEREEPPHIHVRRGGGLAKIWLEPVRLAHAEGLTPAELRRAREIVADHELNFLERWHEHLNR
ncbi:MAG: DUF4160 domain-containing protein [Chloroflexota bacterium]